VSPTRRKPLGVHNASGKPGSLTQFGTTSIMSLFGSKRGFQRFSNNGEESRDQVDFITHATSADDEKLKIIQLFAKILIEGRHMRAFDQDLATHSLMVLAPNRRPRAFPTTSKSDISATCKKIISLPTTGNKDLPVEHTHFDFFFFEGEGPKATSSHSIADE